MCTYILSKCYATSVGTKAYSPRCKPTAKSFRSLATFKDTDRPSDAFNKMKKIQVKEWSRACVTLEKEIGKGYFGTCTPPPLPSPPLPPSPSPTLHVFFKLTELTHYFYKGVVMAGTLQYDPSEPSTVQCAVKTLRPTALPEDRDALLAEASVVTQFSHPHVVACLGQV